MNFNSMFINRPVIQYGNISHREFKNFMRSEKKFLE